ncbi:polymer-forming cytoskeletal protein [Vibrio sp. JC009]|uniref:bactofilin family protein n=1 Tax=Vibrio sp. JC009 TaxID=2912314 RepID=UPI0023B01E5E|nr:polymer-forming cytoskeletal protein [Vibrio sp. JC009]WED23130.1 polymer-forming cytoskeletal protein [Vibrio sp. JC009]
MGLFDKKSGAAGKHHATTVIAEGTVIEGTLNLTGNIQIDGRVKGKINTEKTVTISPSGKVEGAIFADSAIVNGHFDGEIVARNIEILEKGKLQGEISSAEFTIVKGGVFLGNSKTVASEEVVKLKDNKSAQQPQKPESGKAATATKAK